MSLLKEALDAGKFGVTAEMAPPKGYLFDEQMVKNLLNPQVTPPKEEPKMPEAYSRICSQLSQDFGTKVNIAVKGNNKGVIEIPYAGREDLVRILQIFGISESL